MTQAILAFYSQNLWSKQYPRQTQRTLHWILQIVGSSAAIIGMIIEFIGRSQKGKSHFKSIHSLFGLTAGILAVISMLGGVSALWSFEIRKYVRPIYFKLAHNLNGITAFVLGKSSHQSKKNCFCSKLVEICCISLLFSPPQAWSRYIWATTRIIW